MGVPEQITVLFDDARHVACLPYTRANLHKVAGWLGIKRCWYHGGTWPHYDVPKRRASEFACAVIVALLIDEALLDHDDPPKVHVRHVTSREFIEALEN